MIHLKLNTSYLISSLDSAQTIMLVSVMTKHMRQLRSRPCGGLTSVTFHHTHTYTLITVRKLADNSEQYYIIYSNISFKQYNNNNQNSNN